eukprot:COSAG04_NODE_49_length_31209_cov_11.630248_6_plen_243_part_00
MLGMPPCEPKDGEEENARHLLRRFLRYKRACRTARGRGYGWLTGLPRAAPKQRLWRLDHRSCQSGDPAFVDLVTKFPRLRPTWPSTRPAGRGRPEWAWGSSSPSGLSRFWFPPLPSAFIGRRPRAACIARPRLEPTWPTAPEHGAGADSYRSFWRWSLLSPTCSTRRTRTSCRVPTRCTSWWCSRGRTAVPSARWPAPSPSRGCSISPSRARRMWRHSSPGLSRVRARSHPSPRPFCTRAGR